MSRHDFTDRPSTVLDWTNPLTARRILEDRARAAEAEVERLIRGICSLLVHDVRAGRVGAPNLTRLLMGESQPWEAGAE